MSKQLVSIVKKLLDTSATIGIDTPIPLIQHQIELLKQLEGGVQLLSKIKDDASKKLKKTMKGEEKWEQSAKLVLLLSTAELLIDNAKVISKKMSVSACVKAIKKSHDIMVVASHIKHLISESPEDFKKMKAVALQDLSKSQEAHEKHLYAKRYMCVVSGVKGGVVFDRGIDNELAMEALRKTEEQKTTELTDVQVEEFITEWKPINPPKFNQDILIKQIKNYLQNKNTLATLATLVNTASSTVQLSMSKYLLDTYKTPSSLIEFKEKLNDKYNTLYDKEALQRQRDASMNKLYDHM